MFSLLFGFFFQSQVLLSTISIDVLTNKPNKIIFAATIQIILNNYQQMIIYILYFAFKGSCY